MERIQRQDSDKIGYRSFKHAQKVGGDLIKESELIITDNEDHIHIHTSQPNIEGNLYAKERYTIIENRNICAYINQE